MATNDRVVSIHPYFQVSEGKLDEFRQYCEQMVANTQKEPACLYYGFSIAGSQVHCREAYDGAEGLLTHLKNVDALLKKALTISELVRLEIHGAEEEVEKLRGPLTELKPTYFVLEYGFRRL